MSSNWALAWTFFSLSKYPDQLASHSVRMGEGIRWPVHEAEPSSSSCAKVENEWSCASIAPVCLHGIVVDSFYCCFIALVFEMGSVC